MPKIVLSCSGAGARGLFRRDAGLAENVWIRVKNAAIDLDPDARLTPDEVEVPWPAALTMLRQLSKLQTPLGFAFDTDESSEARVQRFIQDYRAVRSAGSGRPTGLSVPEIENRLRELGWNFQSHELKPYQYENLANLVSLSNGANFSVPGAGKTTVTFALHLLVREHAPILLVVAPSNALLAWESIVSECLMDSASSTLREAFVNLTGGEARIAILLGSGAKRFTISYDQLVRVDSLVEQFLATNKVHLVLDESHRMKAGPLSRRGASLLRMGHLALRRDVLSGTPMPQSPLDLQSQLDFLWPGLGLGSRVATGESPRSVLGNYYVRTTKQDLRLPRRGRVNVPVSLSPAHLAFYAVLRDDLRARASELRRGDTAVALIRARRSVIRLLQAAVYPQLVADSLPTGEKESTLLQAVADEGPSNRLRRAAELTEELIAQGKKVLLWTIFTASIDQLRTLLRHHQPALIYGAVLVGDEDDDTSRQGQIRRFKEDPDCKVMIANPAAASEGISLHMQCHDAIYVDRSYNATHFLQSVDRIHRLGLPEETVTTIYVLQNALPAGVGSIDLSVSRRLAVKIRNMERLLADPDLHELALDEEDMPASLEDSIDAQDIDDIVAELENRSPPAPEDEFLT